jgi:hypothetical protein
LQPRTEFQGCRLASRLMEQFLNRSLRRGAASRGIRPEG